MAKKIREEFIRLNRRSSPIIPGMILTRSLPGLVAPQLAVVTVGFAGPAFYGIMVAISMAHQLLCSLAQPRLMKWLGEKYLVWAAGAIQVIGHIMALVGVTTQNQHCLIAFVLMTPGTGAVVDLTLQYRMRKLANDDQLSADGQTNLLSIIGGALAIAISLLGPIQFWIAANIIGSSFVAIASSKRLSPRGEVELASLSSDGSHDKPNKVRIWEDYAFWVGGCSIFLSLVAYHATTTVLPLLYAAWGGAMLGAGNILAAIIQLTMIQNLKTRGPRYAWFALLLASLILAIGLAIGLLDNVIRTSVEPAASTSWVTLLVGFVLTAQTIAVTTAAVVAGKVLHMVAGSVSFRITKSPRANAITPVAWGLAGVVSGVFVVPHASASLIPVLLVATAGCLTHLLCRRWWDNPPQK